MTWVTGTVVYVLVWWVVLFAVLPWGVRTPDRPDVGHASSAPLRPRLAVKFAVTTLIAALVTAAIAALVDSDLVSFRER